MGYVVGIDLGTTNSAISHLNEQGKPVTIPNSEGKSITPSVICFRDNEILVGDMAKEIQALGTYPIAAFFKRQIGDKYFIFHADGQDYSATELSAILLKKLKADAEAYLGEKVTHAVITVPAYFRDSERKETIKAGQAAGLEILQVINEPTAAAVAYGFSSRNTGQKLIVYDLGGGTFDITLLELTSEGVKVCTSDGDHQLGGKDWDDRIIEYFTEQFKDEYGEDPLEDTESLADLLILAEEVKKKLTHLNESSISISHNGLQGRYTLTKEAFEEMTSDLMERTISLTKRILEDMKLSPHDIDGVLLVGGSTRMPMVHKWIESFFGRPPMTGINVDEAVALGAAVVAAEQMNFQLTGSSKKPIFSLPSRAKTIDVTNHSLGMIAVNENYSAYINSIILPKNLEIPCTETRPYRYRTSRNEENKIEVFMTQGENSSPNDAVYVGKYVISDIPHQNGMTVINISYNYDRSGTVNVTAHLAQNNQPLNVCVEELPYDIPDRFLKTPEKPKIEHVTAYLAFDVSGSMSGQPIKEAQKAAYAFLKNTDLTHCSLGIIAVSDHVKTKLHASQNSRSIQKAIDDLSVGETGYSNYSHPFDEIYRLLKKVEGKRFAVVLADGQWSSQDRAILQARKCHSEDIDIIAIGFGDADRSFLRDIASSEEGSFFTSMNGLVQTFSTIAQVITETDGRIVANGMTTTSRSSTGSLGFLSAIRNKLK